MSYKVITPLVALAAAAKSDDLGDANNGPRYFYDGAVIPSGYNDERCEQLVKDGMLEKVKADSGSDADKEPSVKEILADVGDDKEKAAAALAAEQEARGDKARKTLVEPLQAVIDA